ncbi:odorant receptor 10a-like [Homalodisca vitripennis]|uniref:odorant receptor 10a-like n=1 Tax=Homalodisca vitripennis TaxID=197043 RepID=UPI001EECCAB9|nr:odorant receptor 10a-like [Homalodisca vitripennis]
MWSTLKIISCQGEDQIVYLDIPSDRDSVYMRIAKFCLTISGLWKGPEDRTLNKPVVAGIVGFLCLGLLGTLHQLLFIPQDIYKGTEALMHITLLGYSLSTYIILIWKQKTILKMLTLVETNFNDFGKTYIKHNKHQIVAEKNNAVLVITISVIIFSVHSSFIGVSKVYRVHLPPENKSLLFPMTVPLELTNIAYYAVYVLQLMITVCEGYIHITGITLCAGFINILCAQFAALGRAFRLLAPLARHRALHCSAREVVLGWRSDDHVDHHAQDLLKSFVDHHNTLLQFYKDLQSTFGIPILDLFVNSQIMLCSTGFHIFKLYQAGALEQLFKQLCMFAALISHEFVYFWFGSHLNAEVSSFRNDVYACEWTERSARFKRSYRIILERIKRGVTIQAVILPTNLATFAKCLKAAFSYFNLLLALSYKQD